MCPTQEKTTSPPVACPRISTPARSSQIRKSCCSPCLVRPSLRLPHIVLSAVKFPENKGKGRANADVRGDFAGAFTPGCSVRHLPGYLEKYSDFKDKGVDVVVVIAMNDAFVMDAWRKANGVKGDGIVRPFLLCHIIRSYNSA